jgi:hypothetical protein
VTLTDHGRRWTQDPNGGGRFPGLRDAVLAHDQTCTSLNEIWTPHKGGVTGFGDTRDCDGDCNVTFYVEGTITAFEDCPNSWHYYCACCLAKATKCPCPPEELA